MEDGGGRRHVTFDTAKEMQSPRFRAIIRATSGRRKHFRVDIKSFSHELNSRGPQHYQYRIQRAEDTIEKMKFKFSRLKNEVDSELAIFAGDLVGLLEKSEDVHPKWREAIEDLLIVARECAEMPPDEFWSKCEIIVQNLDDRRQELRMGALKQAHTRMLFILTRCTRLLQFYKDGAPPLFDHVLGLHQLSDLGVYPGGMIPHNVRNLINTKDLMQRDKLSQIFSQQSVASPGSRDRMSSWKKLPSAAEKNMKKDQELITDVSSGTESRTGEEERIVNNYHAPSSPKNFEDSSESSSLPKQYQHEQLDGELAMICRICDLGIPRAHAEEHSNICAIANKCDMKGLSVNERLDRVSEVLQKIIESWSSKGVEISPAVRDSSEASSSNAAEPLNIFSKYPNNVCHQSYVCNQEDSCNTRNRDDQTFDSQSVASSTGSRTPQSPPSTPRHAHVEFLTTGSIFSDGENIQQILELLDIVHHVSSINADDYSSLDYLHSFLEDLQEIIQCKKEDALVVETFGRRIEKLLREKYAYILQQIDDGHIEPASASNTNGCSSEAELVHGSRPSPISSKLNDRTSIEDFEIIKPISRGAFGRVFLAKKRVTGDLFAIKVLKKTNMIRKNAVESILAERNILISVRNPFVVRFFYSFTCRENLYLVMEYLNGGDLYSLLRNLGCLDEDMARTYIAEIVLALEYLHSLNVIHRDLKPDNLLIAHDGHIKLTDFGLSKVGLVNSTDDLSGPDLSNSSLLGDPDPITRSPEPNLKREQRQRQSVVGTPDYLAPEILLGMPHGPSADWWSVGIILYELLVGIPPFNAEHPQKIFDNIMNHNIVWPSVPDEMSHEAYDLIRKLLIENPLQRLGATGSGEVKRHPFFKSINWEMLAKQKAAFIPSTETEDDTSYFTSRHAWNSTSRSPVTDDDDTSDSCSMSCDSSHLSFDLDEDGDECGSLADFGGGAISHSVKYSFSNFSFKNLSQLASMNYDLIMKSNSSSAPPTNPLKP